MSKLLYRKDIDGLRAIAILSVMICHAKPSLMPGGYVGVDIFFVISGFLITSIIYQEIQQNTFTFASFYMRRIKRILPAFFTVLFAVLIAGFCLLLPDDFVFLAASAKYATFFSSNIYFAGVTNYFAPNAIETPLIHTWSLAIEEQYYFVWPILLLVMMKFFRRHIIHISLLLCVSSFLLASILAHNESWAAWSFYLLPSRMGELLMGSMLAFYRPVFPPRNAVISLCEVLGVVLIILSIFLLDKHSIFPGYNAFWPCLGALLLIFSPGFSSHVSFLQHFLSSAPLVIIGKLSYSLYLWHWPILAFSRYYTMNEDLSLTWLGICTLATFILAYFSWKYIEQPIRNKKITFKLAFKRYFLLPSLIGLLLILAANYYEDNTLMSADDNLYDRFAFDGGCVNQIYAECAIGSKSPINIKKTIMFGDSHARHYSYVMNEVAKLYSVRLDFYSADSCAFMLDRKYDTSKTCVEFANYVQSKLSEYDNIIIAVRWRRHLQLVKSRNVNDGDVFLKNVETFSQYWSSRGKKVYLIAQVPEYKFDILRVKSLDKDNENPVLIEYAIANQLLESMAEGLPSVFFVSFDAILSSWVNGMIRQEPAYADAHHLNKFGQRQLLAHILSHDEYLWFMRDIASDDK
jgi:peptidoglycan/LPS O-acetylase OafA/YrhL